MRRIAAEKAGFESPGNFRQAARRAGNSGFTHLGRSVARNVAICNAVLPAPLPGGAPAGPAACAAKRSSSSASRSMPLWDGQSARPCQRSSVCRISARAAVIRSAARLSSRRRLVRRKPIRRPPGSRLSRTPEKRTPVLCSSRHQSRVGYGNAK
jgi:hypothetical protein